MRPVFCLVLMSLVLAGCAYRLGPTNGTPAGARSVRVNLFANQTLEPRLTDQVGHALRRILQQDGTFRLERDHDADIILDGVLLDYDRDALSFRPRDILTPRDYQVILTARVTALERSTGRVLFEREVTGRTMLRMFEDLDRVERNAAPLLAEDLARNVAALLVDGDF